MTTLRMLFVIVFILALCVSVIGAFAQENTSNPGDTAVQAFFNNLNTTTHFNINDVQDVRADEPNWCTQSNRWGDGRCNNSDPWIQRYNWWVGWILAHCEIPGYFTAENWPEVCVWGLNASPDEVYRVLFPSVRPVDDTDTDTGGSIVVTTPVPTDVTPTQPTPTDITPTQPTPTEPTPTDVTPTEPTPTEPTPTNAAPIASFSVTCTDLGCSVNAGASSDSDGTIVSYAWDFGDNGTGSGVIGQHDYNVAGNYIITLTVTDNSGAKASASNPVTMTAPNVAPTANFTFSCTNLTCNFDGSGSTDSDGSILSYSWSFNKTGSTASNTFASAGTYSVTLTVTDDDGASATATNSVTVNTTPSVSISCSGGIFITVTNGVAPFSISGGGQPVPISALGVATDISGLNQNANLTLTDANGAFISLGKGKNMCP